jgi:hypothetical protein
VLEVATKTLAEGLTAPAAALESYYVNKKIVKFFVLVTDENENEKYHNQFFPALFLKYHKVSSNTHRILHLWLIF